MYTTWKLTVYSIKMFARNRQAVFFTFFTPLLIMVIFGAIGFDSISKINVGVALGGSLTTPNQQFLGELQKIPVFKLSYGMLTDEQTALQKGDRSIVVVLNNNPFQAPTDPSFASSTVATPRTLKILSNAGDAQAGTALSIINQILDKQTIAVAQAKPLVNESVEEVNSHNLKYIDFLLPGLVALAVMQLSVFSVAFVFVEYKEKGILKRVMATPVRPSQFVVANIITRLIVAVIQALFFIIIGIVFFKVHIVGSYLLILLIVVLGAMMFLGLGFAVSGFSRTTESVPALANLVVFPMIFLGGVFFAIENMPQWLQYISKILPLTYFSESLRNVMNNGASFWDIRYDLLIMLGWTVVLVALATYMFRFDDSQNA